MVLAEYRHGGALVTLQEQAAEGRGRSISHLPTIVAGPRFPNPPDGPPLAER
jgi:hypothetical protein